MFFKKNIIYLSMYENERKTSTVGFLRFDHQGQGYRMRLQAKGLDSWKDDSYPLALETDGTAYNWGTTVIRQGIIEDSRYISRIRGITLQNDICININDSCGVSVFLSKEYCVRGYWKEVSIFYKKSIHEVKQKPEYYEQSIEKPYIDKWSQLRSLYPQVHPFDNETDSFLCMMPEDFGQINPLCKRLISNSFLLHGFYNYRHIILGKYGEDKENIRIGVPGTYFEREKMVAEMFGFEEFRCEGEVNIGKFGYYLKKIELM